MPTRASKIAFFVIFALTGLFFYRTMRPVLLWVGVGAFCAILTWRPYLLLTRKFGGRRELAALVCTAFVVFAVVAPLLLTAVMVTREGMDVAQQWSDAEDTAALTSPTEIPKNIPHVLRGPYRKLRATLPIEAEQLKSATESFARSALLFLSGILASVGETIVGVIIWVLALYYFYLDGPSWLDETRRLLPLPERHTTAFFREFRQVSHAVFYGYVVCSLTQGVLDGAAFYFCGLHGAFLLGTLVAVMALLPMLGSIVIWLPAAIFVFTSGHPILGVALGAWGLTVLLGVDYVLRPILTRGQLEMHPLLVFLAIFGGLTAFGFAGAFLGPLFAALFLAAIRIYSNEFPSRGRSSGTDGLVPVILDEIETPAQPAPLH